VWSLGRQRVGKRLRRRYRIMVTARPPRPINPRESSYLMLKRILFSLAGLLVLGGAAEAAPKLRLQASPDLNQPVWIMTGTNAPATLNNGLPSPDLSFQVWNDGDGTLGAQVSGGFTPWLTPQLDGPLPCPTDPSKTCRRARVMFQTSGLAPGTYQGAVIVSAPGAVDAPQSVPVTIYVGGNAPDDVDLYVPPVAGAGDQIDFQTPAGAAPALAAAGTFLSVTSSNLGSFKTIPHTHRILGRYSAGLPAGENASSVTIAGSSYGPDNKTFPVSLHVANGPIAQLNTRAVLFRATQGVAVADQGLVVSNRGQGSLSVASIDVSTESGGDWLSTQDVGNGVYLVKAAAESLPPGLYSGTLRVNSNAANSSLQVSIMLAVNPPTGPQAAFRGVVNGASFDPNQPLSPGSIVSLFGSQLSYEVPQQGSALPLARQLGGAKVRINGIEAPLFFVSEGQINLQVPFELGPGFAVVQVERDGQLGNQIEARIGQHSIGIFKIGVGQYGAVRNGSQNNNFPIPTDISSSTGIPGAPARPGDVLQIFATGLGPVNPTVPSGEAAGVPLSRLIDQAVVEFGFGFGAVMGKVSFAGLAPGFVGLFQINVEVPVIARSNRRLRLKIAVPGGSTSNVAEIAYER